MILENSKIRLELTRVEDITNIVQIESGNSEFIGQYDFDRHKAVIDSDDEVLFPILDKTNNTQIGHIIFTGLKNENDFIELLRIVISKNI